MVAYPEARAAFARLARGGRSPPPQHDRRVRRLDRDWEDYLRVELTPEVVRGAGGLAEIHALRGFDSIHLASALWLKQRTAAALQFGAFDRRLHAAAGHAGMMVYPRRIRRAG